jgi:hypothetical protein
MRRQPCRKRLSDNQITVLTRTRHGLAKVDTKSLGTWPLWPRAMAKLLSPIATGARWTIRPCTLATMATVRPMKNTGKLTLALGADHYGHADANGLDTAATVAKEATQ